MVDGPAAPQVQCLFRCIQCSLEVKALRFGRSMPQVPNVLFLEDCYLITDPFDASRQPLCVGSHCSVCQSAVCASPSCSVFYTARFCRRCVELHRSRFPAEVLKALAGAGSAAGHR